MGLTDFVRKAVLITGSTAGIGREAALLFARRGAQVVIHGLPSDGFENTRDFLRANGVVDTQMHFCLGPIEDGDFQRRLVAETVERFGRLDVLVNNAGLAAVLGKESNSTEVFDRLIDVNLKAPFALTLLAAEHLAKTRGCIVNNGSVLSEHALGECMPYEMSKGGINQLTRGSALLYAKMGIRVNAVSPGFVSATNLYKQLGVKPENIDVVLRNLTNDYIPMQRNAKAVEIAKTIVFLASADASYMTGAMLAVDGGMTAGWQFKPNPEGFDK